MAEEARFIYHDYETADPPHQAEYLGLVVGHLRKFGVRSVLDAGCGDGNFTASLAGAGFSVWGVDLSEGGIERARQRLPEPAGRFQVRSLYDDFREIGEFDAIVSIEVIEHLYSPRTFVRNAFRALGPGGCLILTTPYWGYLKNLLLALTNRIDRSLTSLWEGGHIKHWSRDTLGRLLRSEGFEVVAFQGTGRRVPWLWKGMMMVARKPGSAERMAQHDGLLAVGPGGDQVDRRSH